MGIPFVSKPIKDAEALLDSSKNCTKTATPIASTEEPAFRRFNDLPPEIRIKIWKFALPGPRIIHLKERRLYMSIFGRDRIRSDVPVLSIGLHYNIPDRYGFGRYFYNPLHHKEVCQYRAARHKSNGYGEYEQLETGASQDSELAMQEGMWGRYQVMKIDDQGLDVDQQRYQNGSVADHEARLEDDILGASLEESDSAIYNYNDRPGFLWGWRSDTPAPALLYVCRESYSIASKVYVRAFGSESAFPETWFDFEMDFLYFNASSFSDLHETTRPSSLYYTGMEKDLSRQDALKVKNIALLLEGPEKSPRLNADTYETFLCGVLAIFRNVQHATVVTEHYQGENYEDGLNPRDDASLAFMEPIDIDKACTKYIDKKPDCREEMELHPALICVDLEVLEEDRLEWDLTNYNPSNDPHLCVKAPLFEMPIINERIISTVATKTKIEGLQREYEQALWRARQWPPAHTCLPGGQDA